MKKAIFSTIFALGLLFFTGSVSQANAQEISGSLGAAKRGGAAKGTIVMDIPGGLHVNSNRPDSEYAIPTTVRLTASGARVSGVTYPRGKKRRFSFSDDAISVYEGRVVFPFSVTVPAGFKGKVVRVRAVVRYQACTDEVCYPPKTKEITLSANVR